VSSERPVESRFAMISSSESTIDVENVSGDSISLDVSGALFVGLEEEAMLMEQTPVSKPECVMPSRPSRYGPSSARQVLCCLVHLNWSIL